MLDHSKQMCGRSLGCSLRNEGLEGELALWD